MYRNVKVRMQRKVLSLRISPELHAKIEDRATKRGISINEWLTLALTHAIERSGDQITVTTKETYHL